LQRLYDANRGRGLEILAVNIIGGDDEANGVAAARALAEAARLTFPVLHGDEASLAEIAGAYGVRGLPAHFLVDAAGDLLLGRDYWGAEGEARLVRDVEALLEARDAGQE
jgi:hypothetical protein